MIEPETIAKLEEQLKSDEGYSLKVYKDSEGLDSIGIGRCLVTKGLTKAECNRLNLGVYSKDEVIAILKVRGITDEEARYLFENDVAQIQEDMNEHLSYFDLLPEMVKLVLLNMTFQNGIYGVLKYKNTLAFIKKGDYKSASVEMLDSTWAKIQSPNRAKKLSKIMAQC